MCLIYIIILSPFCCFSFRRDRLRRKTNRVVLPQALEQHSDGSDAESDRLPPSDDGHGLFDEEFFEEMFEADVRREAKLVEQQQAEAQQAEKQQAERQRTEEQQAERSDSLSSAAGSDISHQREHSHNVRDVTSSFSNTSASSENSADSILGTTTTTTTATSDNELNVVDEQYFAEAVQSSGDNSIASNKDTGKPEACRSQFNNSSYEDLGVIDEHHFASSLDADERTIQTGTVKPSLATNKQTDQLSQLNSEELNYFDQLIVGSGTSESDDVFTLRDENVRNHVHLRSGDITDRKMHRKPILESVSSSRKLNYQKKQTLDKEKFHVKLKSAMTTSEDSLAHTEHASYTGLTDASNTGLTDASNTGLTDDKTGNDGEILQDTQQQNIRLRKNSNKIEFQPRKKQQVRQEGKVESREEEQSPSDE